MINEIQKVKEFMQVFGQETPERPEIPSLEVRKLRARLILEEALETIKGLGIHPSVCPSEDWTNLHDCELCVDIEFDGSKHTPGDLIEIADGLADSMYVGPAGTAIACGFGDKMEDIFNEVHRSNMTKLWKDEEVKDIYHSSLTLPFGQLENCNLKGNLIAKRVAFGRWLVKDANGKCIKSPSYSPANLKQYFE